ncbi:MAG: PAS domain S-box protein [Candidatus Omnitrophica bacterium]|nr:PAS domain S-box protein [Candidatus Omnitrophota bacterium]
MKPATVTATRKVIRTVIRKVCRKATSPSDKERSDHAGESALGTSGFPCFHFTIRKTSAEQVQPKAVQGMKKKDKPDKKNKDHQKKDSGEALMGQGRAKAKMEWLLDETDNLLKSLISKEKEIIQTEDALVEAMRRFRDLFEQSPIGVGIHGTSGELLIVNKSYLDIFGVDSFKEISSQNLFRDLDLSKKEVDRIKEGHVFQHELEYDFVGADYKTDREGVAHILFTISPLFREKEVIAYMVQAQDISQRKQAEESHRLAQLGRLLSDMAHEVNNPLMIISGRAELALLEGVKDEKIKDTLNVILDQCFLAKDIIHRLLRYSRIGKIERTPVDMYKIIDLITNILQHHFQMSNIVLEKEVEEGLPMVIGNEKQLQQVFMNIIRNSADAMPDGGVITLKTHRQGNYIRIDIRDTGEGMSPKVLGRIFEPFFTTKQKGTGLGLAVCHTIIQDHGGKLKYESKIGEGTTATILLPVESRLEE